MTICPVHPAIFSVQDLVKSTENSVVKHKVVEIWISARWDLKESLSMKSPPLPLLKLEHCTTALFNLKLWWRSGRWLFAEHVWFKKGFVFFRWKQCRKSSVWNYGLWRLQKMKQFGCAIKMTLTLSLLLKLFGQDSLQNDSFVLLIDAPAGGWKAQISCNGIWCQNCKQGASSLTGKGQSNFHLGPLSLMTQTGW